MEREHELQDGLIDLGIASTATRGVFGPPTDDVLGIPAAGLTDD
jgi:hypothetical protein